MTFKLFTEDTGLFDECVEQAIKMGRKYMQRKEITKEPNDEEWQLALLLFSKRYNNEI